MSILYKPLIIGGSAFAAGITNAPLAYYRLGEGSGTSAADSSGNGNNGTYSGAGVTYNVTGAIASDTNAAVTFNGSSGYMQMPSAIDPSTWGAFTIEMWVKLSTLSLPSSPAILANELTGSSHKGISWWFNSNATQLNFMIGNGTATTTMTYNYTFATGTWYHLAVTWDGATLTAYINGVQKGTASFAGPIAVSTNLLTVGHNPAGSDYFTGSVDEVSIYPFAWPQATILGHYNTGVLSDGSAYTVTTANVIYATDINQITNALQRQAGSTETGHYCVAGSSYTASSGILSQYVWSLSRNTVPVSASTDTADRAPSANMTTPATNHITHGGMEMYSTCSAVGTNYSAAGNYTLQF